MQAPGSLSKGSLVGPLTDESTPRRIIPLDGFDALRVLSRVYRYVAHGYVARDVHDLHARCDAETVLTGLRNELQKELFGWSA